MKNLLKVAILIAVASIEARADFPINATYICPANPMKILSGYAGSRKLSFAKWGGCSSFQLTYSDLTSEKSQDIMVDGKPRTRAFYQDFNELSSFECHIDHLVETIYFIEDNNTKLVKVFTINYSQDEQGDLHVIPQPGDIAVYPGYDQPEFICKNSQFKAESLTSIIGAVFLRDHSHADLGEAYRDPSGLIWGSLVMDNSRLKTMSEGDADRYCKQIGARLPSDGEYRQLAEYLGAKLHGEEPSTEKYDPTSTAGIDMLQGLSLGYFYTWSSSKFPGKRGDVTNDSVSIFWGDHGDIEPGNRKNNDGAVRCVVGK